MTRNEIIAKWNGMSARERDAWVAEVVFRKKVGRERRPNGSIFVFTDVGMRESLPYYTTDISAAWTVFEHMNADHYVKIERISERVNVTGNYVSEVGEHTGWGTAPEAICLAALIAKLTKGAT